MSPRRSATGPDPHTPAQRRFNMSRVRGKDTRPERLLRHALHALGFRYKLHVRGLPGTPDLVLSRHRAVVFVHGCFWHGHDCRYGVQPATNAAFWAEKIDRNRLRDEAAEWRLAEAGWRVLTVWECALRGPGKGTPEAVAAEAARFIRSDEAFAIIRGDRS